MRRSRGFTLPELLTVMLLQAGFIAVLCGSFYVMVSFYTRTQAVLTARERGQRVIAYIDPRIRAVGVGMWKLNNSNDVYNAMKPLAAEGEKRLLSQYWDLLPIAITSGDKDSTLCVCSNDGKKIIGNVLTILYAVRDNDASKNYFISTAIQYSDLNESININPDIVSVDIRAMVKDDIESIFSFDTPNDIRSWAVMEASGVPMYVGEPANSSSYNLRIGKSDSYNDNIDIYPGSELLRLEVCKMLINGATDEFRGFAYYTTTKGNGKKFDDINNYEKGILEIYMELDKDNYMLDLYVLASGSFNERNDNPKPETWPDEAPWNNDYKKHTLYVSRASWKLHNLEASGFDFPSESYLLTRP